MPTTSRSSSRSSSHPRWANGGKGKSVAPTNPNDLQDFAYAAAERYSGLWIPPSWQQNASLGIGNAALPKVTMWTAWNEPNNPLWLTPQYKRVGKTWRVESAYQYAKICNAVYNGVHSPFLGPLQGEQVACGVTGPKGNDAPNSSRPSVDPLTFLAAAKKFGMKSFDVYAHHPYADKGSEAPSYKPTGAHARRIQMGNLEPADRAGHEALRAEALLDHGVRLPDEPARQDDLRRQLGEAGAVHEAGVRDGACRTRGST